MKVERLILYIVLIFVLLNHFYNGADLTHHVHNTWLYNQMITNQNLITHDPYLLGGEQITFLYGVISYLVGGIAWFAFSYYTVDVIMIILTVVNFLLLDEILKGKNLGITCILATLIPLVNPDTFVAYFSITLFLLGLFLYYKNHKVWQIPLILSVVNHPCFLIGFLYFILKDKKLLAVGAALTSYFIIINYYFSQTGSTPLYLAGVFFHRNLIVLTPVILVENVFKKLSERINKIHKKIKGEENKKVSKWLKAVKKILFYKMPLIYVLLITVSVAYLAGVSMTHVMTFTQIPHTLSTLPYFTEQPVELFNNFPNITGIVRNVDYYFLPSILYSNNNITFTEGSFRENNDIGWYYKRFNWNLTSYQNHLQGNNMDYVLFCKKCLPPTNEREILEENYEATWENEYYKLYSVK